MLEDHGVDKTKTDRAIECSSQYLSFRKTIKRLEEIQAVILLKLKLDYFNMISRMDLAAPHLPQFIQELVRADEKAFRAFARSTFSAVSRSPDSGLDAQLKAMKELTDLFEKERRTGQRACQTVQRRALARLEKFQDECQETEELLSDLADVVEWQAVKIRALAKINKALERIRAHQCVKVSAPEKTTPALAP